MQAALITARETIERRDFPEPVPVPGAAVVQIERCGICGTDVAAWRSGDPYAPFLCGHEWTGTVTATGRDAAAIREGDRVVMAVPPACGACAECRAGHGHRCAAIMALAYGIHPLTPPHGGYAPRIAVPGDSLVVVPDDLDVDAAAMVEPATVVLHAIRRRPPRVGDRVLVLGAGPIGLFAVQLARIAGAGEVYVLEPRAARREVARELGATLALEPGPEADATIRARAGALGVDLVYECSGSQAAIDAAFSLVRPGGAFMLIGVSPGGVRLDPLACITKEILIDNSTAHHHHEFRITMDLMRDGRLLAAPVHSATLPLDRLEEAFARLARGEAAKILIAPGD
ncbi:MAG TPA: zinc-binding dehydrogenase [Myxococcota bacterium]|nr:zinc-binding dehydrogenase [Myxococcota bacterium]